MSDKIKLLHKATTALWLELPESVARDFTDIQQAAIEELQARVEALEGVVETAKIYFIAMQHDALKYPQLRLPEMQMIRLSRILAAFEKDIS